MAKREPMICDRCRVPMNLHAEKPVEPQSAAESLAVGRATGGLLFQEIHRCPDCGDTRTRTATA